ncbi:MAG: glycine cleavage system aminomethyltransferase GcvT [Bacteriovoracia bacterium]
MKQTALLEEHRALGGRLVDFGGWELPVQYSGVIDEHTACRTAAGLFDVSHMGEVDVTGADAEKFLNFLVTNDVAKLAIGQAQYTAMCYPEGGIVDDLVIYRRARDRFLVVVNASNTDKDFAHMQDVLKSTAAKFPEVDLANQSAHYTQIALQGPKAEKILDELTNVDLTKIKTYWFSEGAVMGNIPAIVARTGYTGEDGFEIYVPWNDGPKVWRGLLEAGKPHGLKPCGLGARDTLRLEMKYPLYGNELTAQTNPLEAGLGWVTKLTKGEFMGRDALVHAKEAGLKRKLVGIKLQGRGIPRQGYKVYDASGTKPLGELTSGSQSPSTKDPIGIAYVATGHTDIGTSLMVEIREAKVPAVIVETPFYKRPY